MSISDVERPGLELALQILKKHKPAIVRSPRTGAASEIIERVVAEIEERLYPDPDMEPVTKQAVAPAPAAPAPARQAKAPKTAPPANPVGAQSTTSAPAISGRRRGRPARDMSTSAPGQEPVKDGSSEPKTGNEPTTVNVEKVAAKDNVPEGRVLTVEESEALAQAQSDTMNRNSSSEQTE